MVSSAKPREVSKVGSGPVLRTAPPGDLDRFALPYRQGVRNLTLRSRPAADLIRTFPALLFALSSGYGSAATRERALRLIENGDPLRSAADMLALPWWLRKLPAEAFTAPLESVPDGPEFARRIVNHLPAESWKSAAWLTRVLTAHALAGEEVALWVAWRTKSAPRMRDVNRLVLLCAWAWYSGQPGTLGHKLLRVPFEPSLGLRKAMEEADLWKKRIELAVALGDGIKDTWFGSGAVREHTFVPLVCLDDFLAEAKAMDNCLDQFGPEICRRTSRIFSVRKNDVPVANLEIAPHDDGPTMPAVEQLRGPGNRQASPEVWQATYTWLGQQSPRPLTPSRTSTGSARAVARQIWSPYWRSLADASSRLRLREYLRSGDVLDPEIGEEGDLSGRLHRSTRM